MAETNDPEKLVKQIFYLSMAAVGAFIATVFVFIL